MHKRVFDDLLRTYIYTKTYFAIQWFGCSSAIFATLRPVARACNDELVIALAAELDTPKVGLI